MNEPEGLIINESDFAQVKTPEQAVNFVQHKFQLWDDWFTRRPLPGTNIINSLESITWKHRALIAYGVAVGSLQSMQAVGMIPKPQFKDLKNMAIHAVNRMVAALVSGVNP